MRTHFTTTELPEDATMGQIMMQRTYCGAKGTAQTALYKTTNPEFVDCARCKTKMEANKIAAPAAPEAAPIDIFQMRPESELEKMVTRLSEEQAEAAEAAKHRVYELHTKEKHGARWHCGECLQDDNTGGWEYVEWPCPTIRALEPR